MWLARLFGRRRDDSEPAEFPPHPAADIGAIQQRPKAKLPNGGHAPAAAPKANGFDPYNSGAFSKASAWERVNRR